MRPEINKKNSECIFHQCITLMLHVFFFIIKCNEQCNGIHGAGGACVSELNHTVSPVNMAGCQQGDSVAGIRVV